MCVHKIVREVGEKHGWIYRAKYFYREVGVSTEDNARPVSAEPSREKRYVWHAIGIFNLGLVNRFRATPRVTCRNSSV